MPIKSLAYPSGSYSRELINAAESLGYEFQLAVDFLFEEDRADHRIACRKGLYSDKSCGHQLLELK